MKSTNRLFFAGILILAVLLSFSGCQEPKNPNDDVLEYAMVAAAEDIAQLEQYPNLQSVDLRGSTCYQEISDYIAAHPEVSVQYDVSLGGENIDNEATKLILASGDYDYDILRTNLKYLPNVNYIEFPETELSMDQINALRETYSSVTVDYSVVIQDTVYSLDTTEFDLTWMQPEQLEETAEKLKLLSNLTSVELMNEDGTTALSISDVKKLQDLLPDVFFNYTFELFGKTVSTADEVIEYVEIPIGNEGETEIREALDILTNCTYFKLDDCGVSTDVMAGIRDDYPDVKIVWRIHIKYFNMLTDETTLRLTHELNDDNIGELKYCTDVTYIDVGHNVPLTDISFISYMPNLECIIVSGSSVSDITPIANCHKLIWLELCFCGYVEDLSCLSELSSLKYLNVSYSRVSDLSPLDNLSLERLNCMHTYVSETEQYEFIEKHPDCLSIFEGEQPYGYGWRYNDYGYTYFDYYANMRIVFRYDDLNYFGNHKEK